MTAIAPTRRCLHPAQRALSVFRGTRDIDVDRHLAFDGVELAVRAALVGVLWDAGELSGRGGVAFFFVAHFAVAPLQLSDEATVAFRQIS